MIRVSAEPAQASAGKRVRATSGTLTMTAKKSSVVWLYGLPCAWSWPSSVLAVRTRQRKAITTSATSTRSKRPRRSRGERGGGGLLMPASSPRRKRSGSRLVMPSA